MRYKETVFVFGSNTDGYHGKGAALEAKKYWGAIQGQARGRQGNSYAIVTKDLSGKEIDTKDIFYEIQDFYEYTKYHPDVLFIVTGIGMGLAGWKPFVIKQMFHRKSLDWGFNVYFSSMFLA